jgi:hypothetical protein
MEWLSFWKTLGGTGLAIAALAYLSKSLIGLFLNKDLESYKIKLEAENAMAIEKLRSSLQLEAEKRSVEFTSLHEKRVSMIAELYAHLYDLQSCVNYLYLQYQSREIREDIDRKYLQKTRKEWNLEPGIDTLDPEEEESVKKLGHEVISFLEFYKRNRIYFSSGACNLIDRFVGLSSYCYSNYRNVALKDKDGNLLVNSKVKQVWDKALEVIPQLLIELENEFRRILGVG